MAAGRRDEGGEAVQESERLELDGEGGVGKGPLEPEQELAAGQLAQACEREGRAKVVADEEGESFTVVGVKVSGGLE